jgi:hypothetical protein
MPWATPAPHLRREQENDGRRGFGVSDGHTTDPKMHHVVTSGCAAAMRHTGKHDCCVPHSCTVHLIPLAAAVNSNVAST